MTLVLRIENAERLGPGISSVFRVTESGASIGRRATMDWVLPDPDRLVSGHHFDIAFRGGVYYVSDRSTNGTYIGGTKQRVATDYPLRGGERLLVGRYIIVVDIESARPWPSRAVTINSLPGLRRPSFSRPPDESGVRRPSVTQGTGGRLQVPSLSRSASLDVSHRPVRKLGERDMAPHNEDAASRDRRHAVPPPPARDGMLPSSRNDAMPPSQDRTQAMPSPPGGFAPVPPAGPAPHAERTVFAEAPEEPVAHAHPVAEGMRDPWKAPAGSPAAAGSPAPPDRDDRAALLATFCRAAGLPPETVGTGSAEDLMAVLGESQGIIAEELMRMLKQRGTMKVFMLGAQQTMLGATDNNPLKFMSDRTQALEVLFGPPRDGFTPAPEAFAEALREIRSHHEALLEAMQAALGEVFDGLSPEEIRDTTEDRRPEALWNAYRERWYAKSRSGEFGILDAYLSALERAYATAITRQREP